LNSRRLAFVGWLVVGAVAAAQPGSVTIQRPAIGRQIVASADGLGRGLSNAAALAELRAWNRLVTDAWQAGELTRVAVEDDALIRGRRHERLQQTHREVPIWGGDVRRQLNTFGQTESIFGTYYPDVDIDVTPAIAASRAVGLLSDAGGGPLRTTPPAALQILPTDRGFRLTWTARVRSDADGVERWIFVDAKSGAVIFTYDDSCVRALRAARAGARPTGGVAGPIQPETRAAAEATADYFFKRFGLKDLATGDLSDPAAAIEVVAHELSHRVTAATSGLLHFEEAGALNEAFSEVMALSVKLFAQSPTDAAGLADWSSLGITADVLGGAVPATSGVVTQMFSLAIMGGMTRASSVTVTGVGFEHRDQIERVVYRAFTTLLPARATFNMARAATLQAALDLYGADSPAERALMQAWAAVGVDPK
jgi:Zn-dependent metalloprotease